MSILLYQLQNGSHEYVWEPYEEYPDDMRNYAEENASEQSEETHYPVLIRYGKSEADIAVYVEGKRYVPAGWNGKYGPK